MKFSIIIPAYNAAAYIDRCLDSVVKQDLPPAELEILIINDGSTDDTLQRIGKWNAANVRVITQDNQGSSVARNRGVTEARGEYIWFIDADDFITADCVATLYHRATALNPDILFFELIKTALDGSADYRNCVQDTLPHDTAITGREAILCGYRPSSACAAIYRRQFILDNDLKFYPGIYHQDVQFNYRAVAMADSVIFTSLAPYYYVTNPDSVTTSVRTEKVIKNKIDDIIIAKSFHEFADSIGDRELSLKIHTHADSMIFGVAVQMLNYHKAGKTFLVAPVIDYMRRFDVFPIRMQHPGWKHRLYTPYLNFRLRNY